MNFPAKIDTKEFVKFTDGLYIIGYSEDAFYATIDFK